MKRRPKDMEKSLQNTTKTLMIETGIGNNSLSLIAKQELKINLDM